MQNEKLKIYFDDHSAMMTAELELIMRCRHENEKSDSHANLNEFLKTLHASVELQRDRVRSLLSRLGAKPNLVKDTSGWILEKVGRLKLNGSLTGYSPLSRILEVEALIAAATTRKALWNFIATLAREESEDDQLTCQEFLEICSKEIDELEKIHRLVIRDLMVESSPEKTVSDTEVQT